MLEIILYIAGIIVAIFLIASLLDYFKANNLIKKRGDNYFTVQEFILVLAGSIFNKTKEHIQVVDPVSKLLIESIGFDPNIKNLHR